MHVGKQDAGHLSVRLCFKDQHTSTHLIGKPYHPAHERDGGSSIMMRLIVIER